MWTDHLQVSGYYLGALAVSYFIYAFIAEYLIIGFSMIRNWSANKYYRWGIMALYRVVSLCNRWCYPFLISYLYYGDRLWQWVTVMYAILGVLYVIWVILLITANPIVAEFEKQYFTDK